MAKVKVFFKGGQTSMSHGQNFWYPWKGLVTGNVHNMIYESSASSGKETIAKVTVFFKVGQTLRSRSLSKKFWYL